MTTPEPMTATEARCEFRLICGAGRDGDRVLGRATLSTPPATGELVNLNGTPYVVRERAWAIDLSLHWGNAVGAYRYLRVAPAP